MSKYSFVVLVMLITSFSASSQVFTGINWVNWAQEPNYEGVTGYDENPYDNKRKSYAAIKLNADQFQIQSNETFDTLWNNLGNPQFINKIISLNGDDPYDLETEGNYGAMWKAAHDGSNLYILMMYYDLNRYSSPENYDFVVFTQPKDITRHEPTFQAGVQNNDMEKKNMAYCRFIELGGSNYEFYEGFVSGYETTSGLNGEWYFNYSGYISMDNVSHYWNFDNQIIRAMMIMPFDGALSYPANIYEPEGDQVPLTEGSVIAFDIQSRAWKDPHWYYDFRSVYAWSADNYMVDYSNYYTGHLEILPEKKYNLSIDSEPLEGGIATGDGDYFQGQTVNVSALANEGWIFQKWTINDQMISIQANHSFPLPAEDLILTAHFTNKIPQINFEPFSIDQSLISGETAIQNLVISNTGDNESELIVKISLLSGKHHDPAYWLTIDPLGLELTPDESSGIEIGFNAANLLEGTYSDTLLLLSNDPEMLRSEIPIILSVTGIPAISLSQNELDFGYLGTGATRTRSLMISNPGTGSLVIENIEVENQQFEISFENTILEPSASKKLYITFTSIETGVANSVLTISSNVADQPNISLNLLAETGDLVIKITTTDNTGALIENAFVRIFENDSLFAQAYTNSNGYATFNQLYSSQFSYIVSKDQILLPVT